MDFDELLSFEWLGDFSDLGLIIGIGGSAVLGYFLFADPGNMGMSNLPLMARIIAVVLCAPMLYLIVSKMTGD